LKQKKVLINLKFNQRPHQLLYKVPFSNRFQHTDPFNTLSKTLVMIMDLASRLKTNLENPS